jgi:hypothetical protein
MAKQDKQEAPAVPSEIVSQSTPQEYELKASTKAIHDSLGGLKVPYTNAALLPPEASDWTEDRATVQALSNMLAFTEETAPLRDRLNAVVKTFNGTGLDLTVQQTVKRYTDPSLVKEGEDFEVPSLEDLARVAAEVRLTPPSEGNGAAGTAGKKAVAKVQAAVDAQIAETEALLASLQDSNPQIAAAVAEQLAKIKAAAGGQ